MEREAFAEQLFSSVLGYFGVLSINLGFHLGLYKAMADGEEITSGQPAERAGIAERYGWSLFECLPAGMADRPSAGTGTVMRPDTLRRYATEAGFGGFEILPIEHDSFRLYLLRP